jgi:hypothetical protein|tara:strand:+ start:665 stop:838 length:174 start_codon:yes stop_codon:yes gene_type:complete
MSLAVANFNSTHEETFDLTSPFLHGFPPESDESDFSATVPPHLSEDCVAHWNGDELW